MTFSLIARCETTGRFGVAVASCVLGVGTRIPLVRPGVGAVVVQASGWLQWRQATMDVLDRGMTPAEAVEAARCFSDSDELQVAAVDAYHDAAAHTDTGCMKAAGHSQSGPASAQANTMASEETWPAMLDAFQQADDFADGLVNALAAAEAHGGDLRGRQSAALIIAGPERGQIPTGDADDPTVDLRVDDSPNPIAELTRLLSAHRAHRYLIRAGETDDDEMVNTYMRWAARDAPDDPVCNAAAAIALALNGHLDEAVPLLEHAMTVNPATLRWAHDRAQRSSGNPHAPAFLSELERLEGLHE